MGNRWAKKCRKCGIRYTWEGAMQDDPGCPRCNPKPIKLTAVDMDKWVRDALKQCQEILYLIDTMPEVGWESYGHSAAETVDGIQETIGRRQSVTEKQQEALDNIQAGVEAWFHE